MGVIVFLLKNLTFSLFRVLNNRKNKRRLFTIKNIDFYAATQYRLAVTLLDSLLQADLINESDYDEFRTELAHQFITTKTTPYPN